jgi:hypothetical protein
MLSVVCSDCRQKCKHPHQYGIISHKDRGVYDVRKKSRESQKQIKFLCIEDLVPENPLLRDIDRAIDFSFIYEKVKGLYSEIAWGKPGIDPICLFKIVFIQYLLWNNKLDSPSRNMLSNVN